MTKSTLLTSSNTRSLFNLFNDFKGYMMLLHTAKGVEAWILNFRGYYIALVSMAILYKQDKIDLSV